MVFLDSSIFKGNMIRAPSAMTAFDYILEMLSANFISEIWLSTKAVSIAVTIYLSLWLSGFLLPWIGRRGPVLEKQINPVLPQDPYGCIIYSPSWRCRPVHESEDHLFQIICSETIWKIQAKSFWNCEWTSIWRSFFPVFYQQPLLGALILLGVSAVSLSNFPVDTTRQSSWII